MTPYRIWDEEAEEWLGIGFASFEGADDYITHCLGCDFIRYSIYEKLS